MVGTYYILIGQSAVPVAGSDAAPGSAAWWRAMAEWGWWFEQADRRVALTRVDSHCDVSTVFLGLDHNWNPAAQPLLFETMVFEDGRDEGCWRCSSWLEAEELHARTVARCRTWRERIARRWRRWLRLCERIDRYKAAEADS